MVDERQEAIRRRILLPLGLALAAMLLASFLSLYQLQQWHMDRGHKAQLREVEQLLQGLLKTRFALIQSQAKALAASPGLQQAWQARDRDALLRRAAPMFKALQASDGLTQLYFIAPDRRCFLREHLPSEYGDVIGLRTLERAVRLGKPAQGVEIDKHCALAMRLVWPWRIDGQVVGYIELGMSLARIMPELKSILDVDLLIALDKAYLDAERWQQFAAGHKGASRWEEFSDFVLMGNTLSRLPLHLAWDLRECYAQGRSFTCRLSPAQLKYRCGFVPLIDAGGQQVGRLVTVKNVTEEEMAMLSLMAVLGAISAAVTVVLFGLFYLYIGRLEKALTKARDDLVREIYERRQAQDALRESEERYRELVRNIPVGIYRTAPNPTDDFVMANLALAHMHGYDTVEEFLQTPVAERHWDADRRRELSERLLEQGAIAEEELPITRRDGSLCWGAVSARAIRDDSGQIKHFDGMVEDITHRKQAEQRILEYEEKLRSLASEVSLVQERERRRIATNLHDRIAQTLAFAKIKVGAARRSAESDAVASQLGELSELIDQTIHEARSVMFELSSPVLYELGFEPAVQSLVEQVAQQHALEASFKTDGEPKPLGDDVSVVLYQAVRELLVNVVKHANAHSVTITVERHEPWIKVTAQDDGQGFDSTQVKTPRRWSGGFGLFNIRERLDHLGGRIEIDSQPGSGTRVALFAPLNTDSAPGKEAPR